MQVRHRRSKRQKLAEILDSKHVIPGPSDPAAPVIRVNDLITMTGVPSYLAQGCPLRAMPCLICGQAVGGRCVRVSALVIAAPRPTRATGLMSRAYVTCAHHWPVNETSLHKLAHRLENPGCRCWWCT